MQLDLILSFFAKFIETELGIVYAEHNYFQLQNRLEEIAKLQGKASLVELYDTAQQGISGHFRQLLLDVATNNETSFFRDPKVFKAIEGVLLPHFLVTRPSGKIRIWSAANSTGQEALSTAMLILEQGIKQSRTYNFEILGTDISERALSKARAGFYTQLEVQRGLPAPLMIKYFKKDELDRWGASQDLLRHITYKTLNLKQFFTFPDKFDLILCRNVLIYQSVPGKIEILKKISENLAPNGYLIMGSGESMLGLSNDFDQTVVDGAVLYRKKDKMLMAA